MRISSRIMKIVACFLIITSFSGCWNSRELDELGIVIGVGIDMGEAPGTVKITAQVVKPGEIASSKSGGGGGGKKAFVNFDNTGNTVFSAIRGATDKSSRKLYFPHNEIIIIGRSAAEDGIMKYMDFFMRDPEARANVLVAVARESAGDVLETSPNLEKLPAESIADLIKGQAAATSQSFVTKVKHIKEANMLETSSPVAPIVEISGEGEEKKAVINGTAVFKKDKLVGELDKTESRGLMWIMGEVQSGIIETRCSQGDLVSLEVVRAKGEFTPELKDGKVKIKINISEEGNLGEQYGSEDLTKLSEIVFLEEQKGKVISGEVLAAIKKAQELDSDIFGFGESIHHKYPEEWSKMKDNWDEIFKSIEVEIKVDAELRLAGRINRPSTPQ